MKNLSKRQQVRLAILVFSLLLFPITMNYLSPYIILYGASQGIINGSMLIFAILFLSSLVFGRLWCAWICPAGGLGEVCSLVNNSAIKSKSVDKIKWIIWIIWMALIIFLAGTAGGFKNVDFFLLTESGISVDAPEKYVIYLIVVLTFFLLSVLAGRRAGCHAICWMAPFMIIGRKLRNLGKWAAFRLVSDSEKCIDCKKCTQICPMSLDVNQHVREGNMENSECILCAQCVDVCPQGVIELFVQRGL